MKKMSNVLVFLLCASLLIASFGGCISKKSTDPAPSPATSEPAKTATLKVFVRDESGGIGYDTWATHYIEEKTNTKLQITAMSRNESEMENQLNMLLASGEVPDIFQFVTDQTAINFEKAGIMLPLNKYFDKAPNLYSSRTDRWDSIKSKDGNIYFLGNAMQVAQYATIYRKDWLDKLGLKVPENIDEYYTVAKAIANNDPDKNGKKDTFAFGGNNAVETFYQWDHIFSAYGALPDYWMDVNGKITNGSIMPQAKEALIFMNKLYKEGILDPEFLTDDLTRWNNKFLTNIFGAGAFKYRNINNTYLAPLKKNFPDAEFVVGNNLTGPNNRKNIGFRFMPKRGNFKTAIHAKSKNIDASLRLIDWLCSKEGAVFHLSGVAGTHYSMDKGYGEPLMPSEESKKLGIQHFAIARGGLNMDWNTMQIPFVSQMQVQAEKNALPNPVENIILTELSKSLNGLYTYTLQEYSKMILGETPVEGGFERFVEEWKKRGGEEATKLYNENYKK